MNNSLSDDLVRLRCSTCDGENFGCRGCTEDKKIEEVLKKYNILELDESQLNYDEVLNTWHDKVIEKADQYKKKADDCELGSKEYFKYVNYSNGLYDALAMLSLEENKAKKKLKKEIKNK